MTHAPRPLVSIDVPKLLDKVNERRMELGVSWRRVATMVGAGNAIFTRMQRGGGRTITAVSFARIVNWLGTPAEEFFLHFDGFDDVTEE